MKFRGKMLHRKHLGKYKLPENINAEKDEGYDGHLEWDGESKQVLAMMFAFREAVIAGDHAAVMEVFENMGVAGSEAQLEAICGLVMDRRSAEPLKEALLTAICTGSRPLVEFVLCLFHEFPSEERSGCADSGAFLPHITPLMLACILNNFAIVECLLLRGHTIDLPHHKKCKCSICLQMPNANIVSIRKVDAFRAISSEAFLWLATDDPFAAACAVAKDIEQCIADDNLEFMDSYRYLQTNVQRFATRLADQNWRVEELDVFLAHKCHSPLSSCENPYPRVQMALSAHLRNFAGSANVQRAMGSIWWRGWGNFGSSPMRDTSRVIRHVFFYPILSILFVFTGGKIGKSFNVPLAKYISYMSSYMTFLAALVAMRYLKIAGEPQADHSQYSDWHLTLLESYLFIYLLGMLVERYIEFSQQGLGNYFAFWWRWFDFCLIGVFLLAIHAWASLFLAESDPELATLHRRHWSNWDYFLLYDIYVCTGSILAIWKIFYFFQLIKGLGGSVISVGRCVSTVYNYIIVMAVIMLSFAVGLNLLVQPYLKNTEIRDGIIKSTADHFQGVGYTYRNLYWAFYGYLDPNSSPMVVGNSGPQQLPADHVVTSIATEAILALYHGIIIITVLNLMISLLVKKADEVLDNEELEFKFTRMVIYSEYIGWSSAVPPPFNILLVFKELILRCLSPQHTKCWPEIFLEKNIAKPNPDAAATDCSVFERLMIKLFIRFRSTKECHYKTVYRTEFEKDKMVETVAKVAFMNKSEDTIDESAPPLTVRQATPNIGGKTPITQTPKSKIRK